MVEISKDHNFNLEEPLISNGSTQENNCVNSEDEGQVLKIEGFSRSILSTIMFVIISISTFGLVFILSKWNISLNIFFNFCRTKLSASTHVYVHTRYYHTFLKTFLVSVNQGKVLAFRHQEILYLFENGKFLPLSFEPDISNSKIIEKYGNGYELTEEVKELQMVYGPCQIRVPLRPVWEMVAEALFTPFFFFQVFSFCVWFYEYYYFFATFIISLTFVSIFYSLYQSRSSMKALDTLARRERTVIVHRDAIKVLNSCELVPGDLIEIPKEGELPCDIVLISGTCTVDESMLTGESLPVVKDQIEKTNIKYSVENSKKYTLYEGTKILQIRSYENSPVIGVVVRTGYMTIKGKVIISMLYPKPSEFKFYEDSVKFIICLFFLAIFGFIISMYQMITLGLPTEEILLKCFDLITITVPPSLPATMTIGTAFALKRLSSHQIICISSNRINVAGKVDLVCFDKTGTLTEEGVKLLGVQGKNDSGMQREMSHPSDLEENYEFINCMASCQSLIFMNDKLVGDPQELEIFNNLQWTLNASSDNSRPYVMDQSGQIKLSILKVFHFTSKLKRMGVITVDLNSSQFHFYLKGAPEVLLEKCDPKSIPNELHFILSSYTNNGCRVLACAGKSLQSQSTELKLEDIENGCTFLGLIILQNTLKPETVSAIEKLQEAKIRTVMSTGDAILTAICVARECNILPGDITVYIGETSENKPYWEEILCPEDLNSSHKILNHPPWTTPGTAEKYVLAIAGNFFAGLVHEAEKGELKAIENLNYCLDNCTVYARMSPDHKTLLVQKLHARGSLVAMCGDGTNDCGALKSADIGISLSDADSSIAAPFTSKVSNISSVLTILIEGRCALATSIQCFKYMCLYSMIQSSTVTILYMFGYNLSTAQYLTFDLVTVMPLAVFMAYTLPYPKLSSKSPTASLVTLPVILSIVGQYLLQLATQIWAYYLLSQQDFLDSLNSQEFSNMGPYFSWENTVLFYVSWVMYQIVCISITTGKPWKRPAYTNIVLLCNHLALFAGIAYTFVMPFEWLRDLLSVIYN